MDPVIRLSNVSKAYANGSALEGRRRKKSVLKGIDMVIRQGEIIGLTGRSGSGKSTLARILALMEPPDSGQVFLMGREVDPERLSPGERCQIQYVFQNPASSFNPRMTMWDQLCEAPLQHNPGTKEAVEHQVSELISSLDLSPEGLDRKYPHEFSGGQQQRLALARSLAVNPELLVCDEITASLDPGSTSELLKLLRNVNSARSVAILFISHQLDAVREVAQTILRLSGGSLKVFE